MTARVVPNSQTHGHGMNEKYLLDNEVVCSGRRLKTRAEINITPTVMVVISGCPGRYGMVI